MKKLIKKLDVLATSGMLTHDQVMACDDASVYLLIGDFDSAMLTLNKAHIVL